jgi:hypothetical protein
LGYPRRFDPNTGGYTVGCAGKLHFAAGVRFLAPDVPNRYVDLLLHKNGEPRDKLTPEYGRGFLAAWWSAVSATSSRSTSGTILVSGRT